MGFTYTFVSICGDRFSSWIPRNGSISLHLDSIVNFMEECALLSLSKKLDAVSILGMMVSVSSTYPRSFGFIALCFKKSLLIPILGGWAENIWKEMMWKNWQLLGEKTSRFFLKFSKSIQVLFIKESLPGHWYIYDWKANVLGKPVAPHHSCNKTESYWIIKFDSFRTRLTLVDNRLCYSPKASSW